MLRASSPSGFILLLLLAILDSSFGNVSVSEIFSDHMVLRKADRVPIWGKADPGEKISVTITTQTVSTVAGPDGRWQIFLNLKDFDAGPFEMSIEGKNCIKITDILVGEVWLASGQSNMAFTLREAIGFQEERALPANSMIRQFSAENIASPIPQEDIKGSWISATPCQIGDFSAVGYFFAKALQKDLQTPVGILNITWGGTRIDAWTSFEALDSVPSFADARARTNEKLERYHVNRSKYLLDFQTWLKSNQREDKPSLNTNQFTEEAINPLDWEKVTLPGSLKKYSFPSSGVIWLRKEVLVSNEIAGRSLRITVGAHDNFDTLYWNGHRIDGYDVESLPGRNFKRLFTIPAAAVNPGANILAFRIYAPVEIEEFPLESGSGLTVLGEWLARAEHTFPPLEQKIVSQVPVSPDAPPRPSNMPGYLFNGMVNPVAGYALSGFLWYQGESDVNHAQSYGNAFQLLIKDWREKWKNDLLPFYFCQLPNYRTKETSPTESNWAELREAQTLALQLPHTGQAVLIDLGESGDIHPRNKREVGERLAKTALSKSYGKSIHGLSPTYSSMIVEGNKIRLKFNHVESGLIARSLPETYDVRTESGRTAPLFRNSPESQLEGFAICGSDQKWVWANACIDGNDVLVWTDQIKEPVAVRYAWANNPTANLYSGAGLPVTPFRTDTFTNLD